MKNKEKCDMTNLTVKNEVLQRDVDNLMRTLEEGREELKAAQHRAEVAEKALKTACVNIITDEEDDIAIEPRANVLYKAYLRNAEKELAEEKCL